MAAHTFSTAQLIGGAFSLVTVSVAGTWALRYDRLQELESRVAVYEQSTEWELPQLLEKIGEATSRLDQSLETMARVPDLEQRIGQLTSQLEESRRHTAKAEARLSAAAAALAEKQKMLDQVYLTDVEFEMAERETRVLGREATPLSVVDISSSVTINLDNVSRRLEIGQYQPLKNEGNDCRLLLARISSDYKRVGFRLLCPKIAAQKDAADAGQPGKGAAP